MGVDYLKRQLRKLFQLRHKLKSQYVFNSVQKTLLGISLSSALLLLPSCQKAPISGPTGALTLTVNKAATSTIVSIARTAQDCWFKTKDPTFAKFRLAAEVNSYVGKPRFLLVPKSNPGGLPKLVVNGETKNGKTVVNVFGPLLSTNQGQRISKDVQRWAIGNASCTPKA